MDATADKAGELKRITMEVLGDAPGMKFYARAGKMLDDGAWSSASLVSATREIEKMVRLFVGAEFAVRLKERYKEYFKGHTFHI